jgi:hypothetical protein
MEVDPHPWRSAIVLGCAAIVGGMLVSMVVPVVFGAHNWWIPGDGWRSLRAAHYVPQGTYPLIYETGTGHDVYDAGPLLPLLLAPVAAIGDLFHLQESYPFPRAYPNMWFVFGPYSLASAIPLLYAVRALATQMKIRTGRVALQVLVLLLVFVPMAVVYGHYEDVLALALLCLAFRDLFAARELRGALLVAAAIAFKQWAILAVPIYVVVCAPAVRVRAALRCVVPPAVLFGAFLALDYKWASFALLHPPAFPIFGHSALWVPASSEYLSDAPTRFGVVVVAIAVAWFIRDRRDPAVVMTALGCVFMSRLVFEPVLLSYYLAPAVAFLLLGERARGGRGVTNVILAGALLLSFPLHPNRLLWWVWAYALGTALLAAPARRLMARAHAPVAPVAPSAPAARETALTV